MGDMSWLGGVGQVASGIASSVTSAVTAKKTRQWQSKEAEKERQWQDEQTRRNIEYQKAKEAYDYEKYNSPYARMQALKEAGLNPDLVYQSPTSSTMQESPVASPSSSSAPSAQNPDISSGFSQIGKGLDSLVRTRHELDNIDADTDLKKKKGQEAESITLLNGSKVKLTDSQSRWFKEDTERISAQIKNLDADTSKLNAQISEILANKRLLEASAEEKQQAVYEASTTFQVRYQLLKEQFKEEQAKAGISEKQLDFISRTLEDNIKKVVAERKSTEYNTVLDYWNSVDADYSHSHIYEFKDDKGNVINRGTGARILMDTMVAMASGQSQLLEKQLDLLRTYGSAHAIMSLATEFINALGSASASIMAMKFMSGKGGVKALPLMQSSSAPAHNGVFD